MKVQTRKKTSQEIEKIKSKIRVRKNIKNKLLKTILFFNILQTMALGLLLGTFWEEIVVWLQKILSNV